MPRTKCLICDNGHAATVDDQLAAGRPVAEIASKVGVSRMTVVRHRDACAMTPKADVESDANMIGSDAALPNPSAIIGPMVEEFERLRRVASATEKNNPNASIKASAALMRAGTLLADILYVGPALASIRAEMAAQRGDRSTVISMVREAGNIVGAEQIIQAAERGGMTRDDIENGIVSRFRVVGDTDSGQEFYVDTGEPVRRPKWLRTKEERRQATTDKALAPVVTRPAVEPD